MKRISTVATEQNKNAAEQKLWERLRGCSPRKLNAETARQLSPELKAAPDRFTLSARKPRSPSAALQRSWYPPVSQRKDCQSCLGQSKLHSAVQPNLESGWYSAARRHRFRPDARYRLLHP